MTNRIFNLNNIKRMKSLKTCFQRKKEMEVVLRIKTMSNISKNISSKLKALNRTKEIFQICSIDMFRLPLCSVVVVVVCAGGVLVVCVGVCWCLC